MPIVPQPGAQPLLLAAGRLAVGKNMAGLLRAFSRIAGRCDARLIILGEGPERPTLEAEIRALGLVGRVGLLGYRAEPWDLYRSAAAFVSASVIESFSMVVAEALAYGLPVVAYDSPGPREILADGAFGTLVPAGDEAALGEAMLAALASPCDRDALRNRGAVFSFEAGLAGYQALFDSILDGGGRPDLCDDRSVAPPPTSTRSTRTKSLLAD